MCFFIDAGIDSHMSTSRATCASPCLTISAANSNIKLSFTQVSPSIPALESILIAATVIPSVLGGILIIFSAVVAITIVIVLRVKWQKKKMIDVLEQDFQRR